MSYIELLILAISLSFDTLAVSISGGISLPELKFKQKGKIMLSFALFQATFLFAGWLIGGKFTRIITQWDHWIALVILAYIGGKMIYESLKKGDNHNDESGKELLNSKKLVILSVATSIDAVAVGVSLAFINLTMIKIYTATIITALITFIASYIGLTCGQKLGCYIGKRAEFAGGVVLIIIGIKILIEHLA